MILSTTRRLFETQNQEAGIPLFLIPGAVNNFVSYIVDFEGQSNGSLDFARFRNVFSASSWIFETVADQSVIVLSEDTERFARERMSTFETGEPVFRDLRRLRAHSYKHLQVRGRCAEILRPEQGSPRSGRRFLLGMELAALGVSAAQRRQRPTVMVPFRSFWFCLGISYKTSPLSVPFPEPFPSPYQTRR